MLIAYQMTTSSVAKGFDEGKNLDTINMEEYGQMSLDGPEK